MDGKEFFKAVEHVVPYNQNPTIHDELASSSSEQLHEMLRCLYLAGEVVLLHDEPPTIVEDLASEFLAVDKQIQVMTSYATRQQRQQINAGGNVRFMMTPRQDETHTLPKQDLADIISEALTGARGKLLHDSTRMLSRTVGHARTRRSKIIQGKTTTGDIVRENVGNNARQLTRDLGDNVFHIDVVTGQDGRTLDVQASGRKSTQQLPAWLKYQTDWDDALSNMLGKGMLEFDTYFALLEWCIDRRLPMIPVLTPNNLEQAHKFRGRGNTNSDILLCNLETNDIIPIQVKNSADAEIRNQYIEGMEFVTPTILGLSELGVQPVRDVKGRVRTMSLTTTHYGRLASAYMNKHEKISGKKKGTDDPFAKAFSNFDRMFLG